MQLKLYYICGINREDTPYFPNETKQLAFFESKRITTLGDMYYPPLYVNRIRLSTYTFDPVGSTINYLSLSDGSFTYYYFINDITYVNEGVYELSIVMDTIQTYMFKMFISDALIERRHITRWIKPYPSATSYVINRDYIRENFSKGDFIRGSKHIIEEYNQNMTNSDMFDANGKYIGPWIVGRVDKVTADLWYQSGSTLVKDAEHHVQLYFYRGDRNKGYASGAVFMAPLYHINSCKFRLWSDSSHYTDYDITDETVRLRVGLCDLATACSSPYLSDVHVIRKLPVDHPAQYVFQYNQSSGHWVINATYQETKYYYYSGTDRFFMFHNGRYNLGILFCCSIDTTYSYVVGNMAESDGCVYTSTCAYILEYSLQFAVSEFNFTRCTQAGVPYSNSYITSLLDENYIDFIYGTESSNIRYPLHRLNSSFTTDFKLYNIIDVANGSYTYTIKGTSESFSTNYNTFAVDNNSVKFDMVNDAYKEYVATNRNRWSVAARQDTVNLIGIMAKTGLSSYASTARYRAKVHDILRNPDVYKKDGGLRMSALRSIAGFKGVQADEKFDNMARGLGSLSTGAGFDLYVTEKNNQCLPAPVSQVGEYFTNAFGGTLSLYTQFAKVNDYTYCGMMYHKYGNLVNALYVSNESTYDNLISHYINRYYFNYIRCSDINVSPCAYISFPEYVRDDIIDRFTNGIRFWNIYSPVDNETLLFNTSLTYNMKYDNVELAYL